MRIGDKADRGEQGREDEDDGESAPSDERRWNLTEESAYFFRAEFDVRHEESV